MSIDIEGIAHDVRCDPAGLKTALPLIRQGYSPAFLARYRRDELGGVSEEALLALATEVQREDALAERRAQLVEKYADAERGQPVGKLVAGHAVHQWEMDRAVRVAKAHSSLPVEGLGLATAALCPGSGDPSSLEKLAEKVLGDSDPVKVEAACGAFADAVVEVLCHDLRILRPSAAWLARTARLEIGKVLDPNAVPVTKKKGPKKGEAKDEGADSKKSAEASGSDKQPGEPKAAGPADQVDPESASQSTNAEADPAKPHDATVAEQTQSAPQAGPAETVEGNEKPADSTPDAANAVEADPAKDTPNAESNPAADPATKNDAAESSSSEKEKTSAGTSSVSDSGKGGDSGGKASGSKSSKRLSPRQRRRKWLISVLEPLRNKTLSPTKLSAFQRLVLSRGRRSDLVHPRLVYDKEAFARHIKKQVNKLNPVVGSPIRDAFDSGADQIVAAAEEYFWEALVENAREDLVDSLAKQLDQAVNRKPVEASVVLAIDAIGPRTASVAVVDQQRQLLHTEDVPCQMSPLLRQQLVSRLGELVHQFHVGMIAVSNGPARRACVLAIDELLKQSPEGSLKWTLVERSGADVFASGPAGDHQMRHVPRRFRAAAWIARFLLSPSEAVATIDPTKMRLTSYQRELETDAIRETLEARIRLGLSLRGADANGDSPALLARMPGMDRDLAEKLDAQRRENLFRSREKLAESMPWSDSQRRQAVGFLRVFGSEQTLDGTSIHPEDYPLALRLAEKLGIPTPPAEPPGYVTPDYSEPEAKPDATPDAMSLNVEVVDPGAAGSDSETFGAGVDAEAKSESDSTSESTEQGDADATQQAELSGGDAKSDAAEGADDASAASAEAESEAESPASEPESPAAEEQSDPVAESSADASEAAKEDDTAESSQTPTEEGKVEEAPAEDADSESASGAGEAKPASEPPQLIKPIVHPRPEEAAIERVIKEWQVGKNRVRQIVGWLCEPFSAATTATTPMPSMGRVPALSEMEKGQYVAGVVVGVTGFGAFVELGPECNGLIHVSKLSDGFVQDPHEFVQVGDVVSAWVVDIDQKRKRVALSCVSPDAQSPRQDDRGGRGGRGKRFAKGPQSGGGARSDRGGTGGRSGRPPSGGGRRSSGPGRGGRDGGRGRRGGRSDQPRTIVQVSKMPEPQAEISPAMERGDEPMRSFSDLMQLYEKQNAMPEPADQAKEKKQGDPPATQEKGAAEASAQDGAAETAPAEPAKADAPQDTAGNGSVNGDAQQAEEANSEGKA